MTKKYVCYTPYLRNHVSYDCHLWYKSVKWYLSVFFSFIPNFDFLGCWWGKRAKNVPKWQKIISVMLHISGTIHHMVIYATLVWNGVTSRCLFFSFFLKMLIFWVVSGLKGQKLVENETKFCLSCSISQEQYPSSRTVDLYHHDFWYTGVK